MLSEGNDISRFVGRDSQLESERECHWAESRNRLDRQIPVMVKSLRCNIQELRRSQLVKKKEEARGFQKFNYLFIKRKIFSGSGIGRLFYHSRNRKGSSDADRIPYQLRRKIIIILINKT